MLEAAHASSAPGCTGAQPPVPLTGFIGPSGKDGLVRIYRDLTFRSYYDVPVDAIQPVDVSGDDPEAPSAFFVAADAPITVVEAESECAEAGFLSGSISRGRLGAPPQGAASGPAPDGICKNTANPTYCEPLCITLFTAYPTWCPPTGTTLEAGANVPQPDALLCITLFTAHPTSCPPTTDPQMAGVDMGKPVMAGNYCITLWTAYPSWCPPTTTTATALQAGPICITLWTAYPSWCPPTCNNTGVPTSCG